MENAEQKKSDIIQQTGINRFISLVEKTGSAIDSITGAVCVLLIAIMAIVVLISVFFRYVLGNPFIWSEELSRFLLLWAGFLGISIAMRRDAHIKIDFVVNALPSIWRKIVEILLDLLIIAFLVLLLIKGYKMAAGSIMKAMSMNFSMSWILVAVPISALLTLIQLILLKIRKTLLFFINPAVQQTK